LVGLTIAGVVVGTLANRVERQRRAVGAILKAGGRITYDHSTAIGTRIHSEGNSSPHWLRKQLGEDWFSSVHGVTLYGDGCNDATLAHVKSLPNVRFIALWAWAAPPHEDDPMGGKVNTNQPLSGITDQGLLVLKSLRKLEHVSFLGNQMTDAGLKHLHHHPTLKSVQVGYSNCTQQGIALLMSSLGPGASLH
jgi:hypothetical protein